MVKKSLIPNVVTVCGIDYEIIVQPFIAHNNETAYGMCHEETCTIEVREGMPLQRLKEVLLHEVLHAVSNETNIDLNENQVHNLAIQILDVLRRNELLRKILVSEND